VTFDGADLRGAVLDGAQIDDVTLRGATIDLRMAVALAEYRGAIVDTSG